MESYRGVAQLVARLVWDQDAGGSSPLTPISHIQVDDMKEIGI